MRPSRVRSRNPPAARSRISGSSASSVAARPISAVEATCGRWLTIATSRSWRSGVMSHGPRAEAFDPGFEHVGRPRPGRRGGASRPRRCRRAPRRTHARARSARCRPWGGPAHTAPQLRSSTPSAARTSADDPLLHAGDVGDDRVAGPPATPRPPWGRPPRSGWRPRRCRRRPPHPRGEVEGRARSIAAAREAVSVSRSQPVTRHPARAAAIADRRADQAGAEHGDQLGRVGVRWRRRGHRAVSPRRRGTRA